MVIGIFQSGIVALMLSGTTLVPMPSDGPATVFMRSLIQPAVVLFYLKSSHQQEAAMKELRALEKIEN